MGPANQANMKVFERFPDQRTEIVRRSVVAPDFRSLCQEYEDCARALKHWSQAAEAPSERVLEYTQLLEELEHEIQEILGSQS